MKTSEIIAGLEDLIEDRKSFIMPNEPDSIFAHDKAVLEAAIDELNRRAAPENKALTLEQLRKMNGEPVWVKDNVHPEYSKWKICNGAGISHYYFFTGTADELRNYGKTWLAYARKPGGSET